MSVRLRRAWTAPRAPTHVLAYHGCHAEIAERVLSGEQFLHSSNEYDWLGSGIYFWEYAPYRALDWAKKKFGNDAAVIEATVTLTECLNLMDSPHFADLQLAYKGVVRTLQADGIPIPTNKHGRHTLDCMVIDTFCDDRDTATGTPFSVVRGCFPEGSAVYKGSQILQYTHVQIAVREESCISDLNLVHF